MATAAQIQANRLNALKSTGPRTEEGKSASRLNALQHGVDAQLEVIPGEDPGQLEALRDAYRAEWQPVGLEQEFLVETLVQADWNRRRYRRIEADLINHALSTMDPCDHPLGALFAANTPATRAIERAVKHYEAAHRAWMRALSELRKIRESAADAAVFAMMAPPPLARPAVADVTPLTSTPTSENWVRSVESPAPGNSPARPGPTAMPAPPKAPPSGPDNPALRL